MQEKGISTWAMIAVTMSVLAGCGGGGDGGNSGNAGTVPPVPPAPSYAVTGMVSGLLSGSTVLLKNGNDTLSVAADGSFTMPARQASGSLYQLEVATQPVDQTCSVHGGQGQVADSAPQVDVACLPFSLVAGSYRSPVSLGSKLAADGNGNVYFAGEDSAIYKVSSRGAVTLFAGMPGRWDTIDGPALSAGFSGPTGLVFDNAGNLFVADLIGNTIRKISAAGVVSTVAGGIDKMGFADGIGSAARFSLPQGLAIDKAGTLYVSDVGNNAIRKVSTGGEVSTLIRSPGSGRNCEGPTCFLGAIALDSGGNVYASVGNYQVNKVTADGKAQTISQLGALGLTSNAAGQLYLMASPGQWNTAGCVVCRLNSDGTLAMLAGDPLNRGYVDGVGAAAKFDSPYELTADKAGNLYLWDYSSVVTDSGVYVPILLRKVAPDGRVTTLYKDEVRVGYADGTGSAARFAGGAGLGKDAAGNLYVSDSANAVIRKISPAGVVSTLAGTARQPGQVDGRGAAARFKQPKALVVDAAGTIYVIDQLGSGPDDYSGTIRKITPDGMASTLVGPGNGLNLGRDGRMVRDTAGNFYITRNGYNNVLKISSTGSITSLAGTEDQFGESGDVDGVGAAARFNGPRDLVIDQAGNLYVFDDGNLKIRKIALDGTVVTVAGGKSGEQDGQGTAAGLSHGLGLTMAEDGSLYMLGSSRQTLRKMDPTGLVSTVRARFPFQHGVVVGRTMYAVDETTVVKITLP